MTHLPTPKGTATNGGSPMLPQAAKITAIKNEAYAIATYTLSFNDQRLAQNYRFAPGQFNMLYLPGIGEVPISISSDPTDSSSDPAKGGTLGHTIRYAGSVTRAISQLQEGDVVGLRGPFGSAWPMERLRGQDVCIVTGGIGLAPLRPVLYAIIRQREKYGRVNLLYGARTPSDMLYTDEFDTWRSHDIQIEITVDRADASWKGHVGVVPMLFYYLRLDSQKTSVLTCGPEVMMRFVIYEALARRIPKDRIYVSMERNMKCGIGLCGHCQLGPVFLCKEGPVLPYGQVEPFFAVEDF